MAGDRTATRRQRGTTVPAGPAVVIRSRNEGRAALAAARAAGCGAALRSAPGAAAREGAGWFAALEAALRAEFPNVAFTVSLDCGRAPGHALGALREGVRLVRLDAPPAVRRKIDQIARKSGARLDGDKAPALNLAGEADPADALARWFGRH